MIFGLIGLFFAIILVMFFCIKHKKKLTKEFEQKITKFQEYIKIFFSEYFNLLNRYITESDENKITTKWKDLYSEISKYHLSKKHRSFAEIEQFKITYGNIHNYISQNNAEIKRKEEIIIYAQKVSDFFRAFNELTSQYVSHSNELTFVSKWEHLSTKIDKLPIRNEDEERSEIEHFKTVFKSIHGYIETANELFIKNESIKYNILFSNIDGKSLDAQQRTAVITNEDKTLVLAGAGSGKTLTIAAKVKYLCEAKKVNPEDILLISFTRKAAQEMTDRIQQKMFVPVYATTFHKLGLDIIKNADDVHPEVSDDNALNQFVHNFFEKDLINHKELIKDLLVYFTYFLEIPKNMEEYSSLGELYEDEKHTDLETLKSKYDREKYLKEKATEKAKTYDTLNNEKVKSLEETKIANFLFLHGVNYEYEKLYPFESDDPLRKAYHPDFYLTDYDIYLEHFGISKDFKVPWLSPVEEKKYLDGIVWKRNIHEKNNTKLIETYSYYNSEGKLLQKLEEILLANGVEFKPRDFVDIFSTVYESKSNKYFSEFIKLCCTFITLFKSNNYKIEHIETLRHECFTQEKNEFMRERTNLFLYIIKILLNEYQKYLSANNAIDFSDMINNATEKIISGFKIPSYQYVIVDEYQDISKSRFNFLKAIVDKTNAKLFCVGDDWQSIYRFAGSDISLFTGFGKQFGYTKTLKIEKTYRNSQRLITEASRFVLQNPLQLRKELRSDKSLDYPLVFWGFDEDPKNALNSIIKKIVSDFGTDSSILLLGRTNYDIEIAKQTELFKITHKGQKENLKYIEIPELKIDFMTVHKSKGLEADNVILLNFTNDILGFPNRIADDKVLDLVLTKPEDFSFAEERRLFYVAITRTRNRTFILTDNKNPSPFFKEFNESKSVCFISIRNSKKENQINCPLCKTGILMKVPYDGKTFVGCSNFPKCNFTLRDSSILLHPKKCPSCGGFLIRRHDKNHHAFLGCTNYPYCEYTEEIKSR